MGLGGVLAESALLIQRNGAVCGVSVPFAFQLWLFLEIVPWDLVPTNRTSRKFLSSSPGQGHSHPLSAILRYLTMSHDMQLGINFVVNLLASGNITM